MISMERLAVCSHPDCRTVLPADPDDEINAGFWAIKREGGLGSRVHRYQRRCKDCVREHNRRRAGILKRGTPYKQRVPMTPEERARKEQESMARLLILQSRPELRLHSRQHDIERKRRDRRKAGILPRFPNKVEERLPIEPLRKLLREVDGRNELRFLAEDIGVSHSRLYRMMVGAPTKCNRNDKRYEVKNVSFPLALRIVRALDIALADVWPEQYAPD
jgi:hypothetical protein